MSASEAASVRLSDYLAGFLERADLAQVNAKAASGEEIRLEVLLEYVPLGQFLQMAKDIHNGTVLENPGYDKSHKLSYLHEWLKFTQSESSVAGMRWEYLAGQLAQKGEEQVPNRDKFALDLWRKIVTKGTPEAELVPYVEERWSGWDFYRRHFFGWFLARFNLPAACAVHDDSWLARNLHLLWSGLVILIAAVALAWTRHLNVLVLVLAIIGCATVAGGYVCARREILPCYAYFHALIPRLGAAIGIGYLFLLSAPHLVKLLDQSWRKPFHFWLASVVLLVAAFLYIAFHISRRVHPHLRWKHLALRSLSLWLLGFGYSALELLVMAPVLFSSDLVCGTPDCHVNASADRLTLCAAIALNLGVILQLAWDEKPLTEPL